MLFAEVGEDIKSTGSMVNCCVNRNEDVDH